MTTNVKIEAHCKPDTEVRVTVPGGPEVVLQDGETLTCHVYDDRMVAVREVPKQSD